MAMLEHIVCLVILSASMAIICLRCVEVAGNAIPTETDLKEFEAIVETAMDCRHIAGAQMVIVKEDNVIMNKGFGMADINNNKPVTSQTKFFIGDLTVAFTATLLAKLMEDRNNITWETTVHAVLGNDFELSDPMLTKMATIEDLLLHRLGIPVYFHGFVHGYPGPADDADILLRGLKYLEATAPVRTNFFFNCYLVATAGIVAERLAGGTRSWEDLIREHIFSPLGMHNSGFLDVTDFSDFAVAYGYIDGEFRPLSQDLIQFLNLVEREAGIHANGDDMAQWLKFILQKGKSPLTGDQYLKTESLEKMFTGQTTGAFPSYALVKPPFPVSYFQIAAALGWMESNYRGHRMMWHLSNVFGMFSMIGILPEMQAGVYFSLTGADKHNNWIHFYKTILYNGLDLLLGEEPWLNQTTVCTFPQPWASSSESQAGENGITSTGSQDNNKCMNAVIYDSDQRRTAVTNIKHIPLESFTGFYAHPFFPDITVNFTMVDNHKTLTLWQGRFAQILLDPMHGGHDSCTFSGKYVGALWLVDITDPNVLSGSIRFTWDVDGQVLSVDLLEGINQVDLQDVYSQSVTRFLKSDQSNIGKLQGSGCNVSQRACDKYVMFGSLITVLFVSIKYT